MESLLFCINNKYEIKVIKEDLTNNDELNELIASIDNSKITIWLPGATNKDIDGDINLSKIYKLQFPKQTSENLNYIKQQLESINIVHSTEYEYLRKPFYTPNDSYYNNQWYLPAIQSNNAWDIWINNGNIPGNENIILASVDLGVNYSHPDLKNNIWQNLAEDADGDGRTIEGSGSNWYLDPGDLNGIDDDDWDNNPNTFIDDLIGWDPAGYGGIDDNNPDPPHNNAWSHGTHVAGLLAATTDNNLGIASTAFNCKIMAVKVSDENQSGQIYITDGFAGILYAAKAGYYSEGFTIINNSWGGIGYNQYEQATINVCYNDYNSIIVCAGGNGNNGQEYARQFPSGYDNVIAVAPLGANNQWNHWATYHETIDLSSPGENIRSTTCNGYASWDGSSMASPIAASVFGLLKSLHPDWNNVMLETMVLGTADPIIYNINNENYLEGMLGTGRVDSYYAITTPLFPKIEYVGEDILSGNDQSIQPGETCELFIILFNNPNWGHATNLYATLETNNPYIDIINSTANYGNINSGEAMIATPYILEFDTNIPTGNFELTLNITSNENNHIMYNNSIILNYSIENSSFDIGDMNQDLTISILDIILLVNIVLGNNPASDYDLITGDINQDSILNILDIINLVNLILQ
jgi:subtilisin family serine protease